jgi:hypothetical protein
MSSNLQRAAAALREARLSRRQIAPVAATYGLGSVDEAYAVAALNTEARLAEGRRVIGGKIGLTAESVQRQLGVDQPDFGVLFDDMELFDRDIVPSDRLMQPKVEAEIAFVIGRDLQRQASSRGGRSTMHCQRSRSSTAPSPTGKSESSTRLPTPRPACTCSATSRCRLERSSSPAWRPCSAATARPFRKAKAARVSVIP